MKDMSKYAHSASDNTNPSAHKYHTDVDNQRYLASQNTENAAVMDRAGSMELEKNMPSTKFDKDSPTPYSVPYYNKVLNGKGTGETGDVNG